jgi:hypothetical protein
VLTPHPGYVTTRTMTHSYAGAIGDIEAWQRGTDPAADIRLARPVSQRWWPVSELAGTCQPGP